MDAATLWHDAALAPDDIDVIQTYDDYPVISMLQFEDFGFCAKDAGAEYIRGNVSAPTAIALTTLAEASSPAGKQAQPAASWASSKPCASSPTRPARIRCRCPARPGQRLRHDQL